MPPQQARGSSQSTSPLLTTAPNSSRLQEVWPFFSQLQRDHTMDGPLGDGNVGRATWCLPSKDNTELDAFSPAQGSDQCGGSQEVEGEVAA